jgi:predicted GNAT family acetyltransferase
MSDVQVIDNPDRSRYEAHIDGRLAGYAVYERAPGRITFVHTIVQPAFEGHGVGGALARASLDQARAAGDEVIPICPFYVGWLRKHPDYLDVVAASARDELSA